VDAGGGGPPRRYVGVGGGGGGGKELGPLIICKVTVLGGVRYLKIREGMTAWVRRTAPQTIQHLSDFAQRLYSLAAICSL